MKLFKAGKHEASSVTAYDRAALEDFPLFPVVPDDVAVDAPPEEEPVDLEALRMEVLTAAKEEAAALVLQAYQEGLRRGEEAGRTAFDARVAGLAEILEQTASELKAAREAFLDTLEPQVVELVALAARRTLRREIATDPDLLKTTVRRALATLADRQEIVVRVHPQDATSLQDLKVSLLEDFHGIEEFHISADDAVPQGSCMIDSKTMQADARLESLLEDVLAKLWS